VAPVLDIVIENSPVLIVVEAAQEQRRAPFHHPQGFRGLGGIEVGQNDRCILVYIRS
jgi:hypothetical protein